MIRIEIELFVPQGDEDRVLATAASVATSLTTSLTSLSGVVHRIAVEEADA